MPIQEEIVRSIFAAWRIARFDAGAMRFFNLSLEGFWRSFIAAGLILPFYLVLVGLEFSHVAEQIESQLQPSQKAMLQVTLFGYASIELLNFAVRWAAWPLLMVPVTRFFKLDANYVPYIIAANWGAVLRFAVMFPIFLLFFFEVLPQQAIGALLVIAYISVLYYEYLLVRAGLQCDWITAAGVVALKFIVDLGLNHSFNQLH
tara:strand:+ start:97 stop:705 length:609 start_codon:yes stop_codon:yes gene_type:complete